MLNSAGIDSPLSSTMAPPSDAPRSNERGTYLGTGDLPKDDNCRFKGSAQRSVTTAHTANLLATVDPARQDSEGNTPLCLAAQAGNLVEAQQLIHRGADVHHSNLDGDNALTLAAIGGHLTFIRWLDSQYPQPVNHENYYAQTALTLAARHGHQPLVQWLVGRDASVTHLNDQLKDALAEAVANGHLALAIWLSSQGTDLRRVYPDGNNLFLHAVHAGHQGMVQWLEDSGVNSQQINESGDNALTLAARHGHHQLLARLLGKNAAGSHQISRNGDSLVLMAAREGHSETVKLLVQHDVDTGLANYAGSNVLTLAATSSEPLAVWLCSIGINIHHIDFSGDNAFTLAAQSGFYQLLQMLEQLGINIHQVNHNSDNAFTLVAGQGSLPWCQWLAGKGTNIHQVNHQHHNAFTLAALAGSQPLLEWLYNENVDWQQIPQTPPLSSRFFDPGYGFNAAILAACAGHFTAAQWLTERGLSIHQRDHFGRNAVIQAVSQGHLEAAQWLTAQGIIPDRFPDGFPDLLKNRDYNAMSLAVGLGHLHIVQWLQQNGGPLKDQDDHERILLLMAARCGDLPTTRWLCRQGADLGRLDLSKASTLNVAVSCGHLRLSQWLVGQGVEDIPDMDGNDALKLAAKGGHNTIFRWLIRSRHLADQQANNLLLCALRSGRRSLAVWLCLKVCKSISGADSKNRNALMLAAKHGFLWLTQWLSKATPDINQTDREGNTALMLAAANGHLPVVQWLCLARNADLQQKNVFGSDALHLAVLKGQVGTAKWLTGQGMVLSRDFFTLYQFDHRIRWTSKRNNAELLQYLLRQQIVPKSLLPAMFGAAGHGDLPAIACCLSPGTGLKPSDSFLENNGFIAAAAGGSLTTIEFLCHFPGSDHDIECIKKAAVLSAAGNGNLHIIQWFWQRGGLSQDEKDGCLLAAAASGHVHVVKWLYGQGADIWAKDKRRWDSFSVAMLHGNLPMLDWFYQQGGDLGQVEVNGKSALSMAIGFGQAQVALWLFQRGFFLTKDDFDCIHTRPHPVAQILGMVFRMTSKIRRFILFHTADPGQKVWLLRQLQLCSDYVNPSEREANARFARFNQYSDKTLKHNCLVELAGLIVQQAGTLEAGLKAIDNLPITSDCKFDLRELLRPISFK